jgi:polyribonucleotide nucleotidyltransferase
MFNIDEKIIPWGGKELKLETGKVARQATGSIVASMGKTVVLCTVVAAKKPKEGVDFFPLTVNYNERFYAAGKIPGGFNKREGRPADRETLISRLADRPIRPLFMEGFFNEVQVTCTTLSYDPECQPDIVAMAGISAALAISGIPFNGPIAAARVGYKDGEYLLNPSVEQIADGSLLDLVVAGTEKAVLMVESEAKELSEEVMLGAVMFGFEQFQTVIKAIKEFAKVAGKPKWEVEPQDNSEIKQKVKELAQAKIEDAYANIDKQVRRALLDEVKQELKKQLVETEGLQELWVNYCLKELEAEIVRGAIIGKKKRIDGRTTTDIRRIESEVNFLPSVHGSALFTRGETQALVALTLGTGSDEQIVDDLESDRKERFLLHYNFPPYSVGETGAMRAPGRREIGHGKLAARAVAALIPTKEEFPYTIRVVSEITESNGSSSMATVCGTSLALMAAGVPLKSPIAGIAMGLILEGKKYEVLSDIMGDEDHLGDMDFKVAGTLEGITALQMDIKISGITEEIMKKALDQAKDGRIHILGEMSKTLTASKPELAEHAPQIKKLMVPKDRIGEIIGPGGKIIKDIIEKTKVKIDISDDGTVLVAATSAESMQAGLGMINDIIAVPELGEIYKGQVSRIADFGAFVSIMKNSEGLVHVSEMADYRVRNPRDLVKEGDEVSVKVIEIDRTGKVRLTMKGLNDFGSQPETDDEGQESQPRSDENSDYEPRKPRSGGGHRRDNRRQGGGGRDRDRGGDRGREGSGEYRGRDNRGGDRPRNNDRRERGDRDRQQANVHHDPQGSASSKKRRFF